MQIQKLNTVHFTRGNSLRMEFVVSDNNVPLQDYDGFRITIRKGRNDQGVAILETSLGDGITIDIPEQKIILTASKEKTKDWVSGSYFGELETIYDGATWAEAEFLFELRHNINSI